VSQLYRSEVCKGLRASSQQGCYILNALVKNPFPAYSDCWLKSGFCGYRSEDPVFFLATNKVRVVPSS